MKKLYLVLLIQLIPFLFTQTNAQIYVNHAATGQNDGTSWEDAYNDLQDALSQAIDGDDIWVAEGTYFPGEHPDSSFLINANLSLYGGFVGMESSLEERDDPTNHPTILSGDINEDDVAGNFLNYREDNTNHILMAPDTSGNWMIDGFTISGGKARFGIGVQPSGPDFSPYNGGGILSFASCIVRNCLFQQNTAAWAGAGLVAEYGDEVIIENCLFENNSARNGTVTVGFHINSEVTNCQFVENQTGLYMGNLNGTVKDCQFTNNVVTYAPGLGGINLFQNSTAISDPRVTIKNCMFSGNTGKDGAAMRVLNFVEGSQLVVEDCLFENNQSTGSTSGSSNGAGIKLHNLSTLDVEVLRTRFDGNTAVWGGGLYAYNDAGSTTQLELDSCTFVGNTAEKDGGGIAIDSEGSANSPTSLKRCIFENNSSDEQGAGFYFSSANSLAIIDNVAFSNNEGQSCMYNNAGMTLRNVTLYANSTGIEQVGNANLSLQNCILANDGENYQHSGSATASSRGGNLSDDSSLTSILTGADGYADFNETPPFLNSDLRPGANSPCLDAGNPDGVAPDATDAAGNPRIQGNGIDMGAFESLVTATREVVAANIEVYPNPTSDLIRIQLPEDLSNAVHLQIFNANGSMVRQEIVGKGDFLDVKELLRGSYLIKAQVNQAIYYGRFIKQ